MVYTNSDSPEFHIVSTADIDSGNADGWGINIGYDAVVRLVGIEAWSRNTLRRLKLAINTPATNMADTTGTISALTEVTPSTYTAIYTCLLYTSPSPRDRTRSRMPSSA